MEKEIDKIHAELQTRFQGSRIPTAAQTLARATDPASGMLVTSDTTQVDTAITGNITTQNTVPAGVAPAGSALEIDTKGKSVLAFQISGTYTGVLSIQLMLEGSTSWVTLTGAASIRNVASGASSATVASGTQGIFIVDVSGSTKARLTALAAVTGIAAVSLRGATADSQVALGAPIPSGSNTIGGVTISAGATNIAKAEDAAHASGDVGVPDLGVRYGSLTAPSSGDNDYGFKMLDDLNKQVVMPYTHLNNQVQGVTASMTGTADTAVLASAGAGLRNYVTSISVTNTSATATVVAVKDGTTVIDYILAPANGYNDKQFPTPLKGTAATAINLTNLTTGAAVLGSAQGFKAL